MSRGRDMAAAGRLRSRARVVAVALACIGALAEPAQAQTAARTVAASYAPVPLPPRHWSLDAIRVLDALGLAPRGFDATRVTHDQRTIALLLDEAATSLEDAPRSAGLYELVDGWRSTFAQEFARTGSSPFDRLQGSRAGIGYRAETGRIQTGWGYETDHPSLVEWNAARNLEDREGAEARATVQAALTGRLGVGASGTVGVDDRVDALFASGAVGPIVIRAGRTRAGYATGHGGGVVLSGAPFDGVGIAAERPLRLPWFLGALGPVDFDFVLAQRDQPHAFEDALFLITRGTIEPHERVALGVTRAVEFGGEGNTEADWFAIFSVLIGKHAGVGSEFDNQVVSVDAHYRLPTERWLPLSAYLEWGFEDSAGAWKDVPGLLVGVEIPSVPSLPWLRLAVERVDLADECCSNPIWYRNLFFVDGWTHEGAPLGHPVAGEGTEWLAVVGAMGPDARTRAELRAFHRDRRPETLYEPLRQGESLGGALRAGWTLYGAAEIFIEASLEQGDDWTQSGLTVGLTATY